MIIKKEDLKEFIKHLTKKYDVFGPSENKFKRIKSFDEIELDKKMLYSPKKIFFPMEEEIFSFKGNKIKMKPMPRKKRVLFGVRPCDMNAIICLDKIFKRDEYYKARRKNTFILGIQCTKPFENCFCHLTDSFESTNYDLLFIESGDVFFVDIGSEKGKKLVKGFRHKMKRVSAKRIQTLMDLLRQDFRTRKNKVILKPDDKKIKKFVSKCLSCGACTNVCPTCNCFILEDKTNVDLKSGKRVREWDYCHLYRHSRVAGDVLFRPEREQRLRQWIHCKFDYFKERHGMLSCTGCGRCVDVCPMKINIFEGLNYEKSV